MTALRHARRGFPYAFAHRISSSTPRARFGASWTSR
jgi:hypothetical protein